MSLNPISRQAAFAQETDEVFLILLTIDHPDFAEPIRVVNNMENITSNGDEYIGYPFELILPDEDEGREIVAKLTIDNISREIMQAIRTITDPPTADVSVIRATNPDNPELALPTLTLRNVTWDALAISGQLVLGDITTEPYPQFDFTPAYFPGLF